MLFRQKGAQNRSQQGAAKYDREDKERDQQSVHPEGLSASQLFGRQVCQSLNLRDRRRIPFTRKRFELWAIKTHGQVECPLRRGQPVDFPVFAGTFVLKVKVERSIRVGLEGKVTADRKTIEPVRYQKAFTGGVAPLSKWIVYLFAPSSGLPVSSNRLSG